MGRFAQEVGTSSWALVWAAGAVTTSSSVGEARAELEPLRVLLTALRQNLPAGPGSVFLTSSAGGVYAGSREPPFDATTAPCPLSPYGDLKLEQELLAADLLMGVCPLIVGRLSNIYGPGQNLDKLQGLVSRLAVSAALQQPINVFVPLDTIRDYIQVDDAASEILRAVRETPDSSVTTQVIASGQSVTVGQLIRTMSQVTKRRVPVAFGIHPSSTAQAADLRLIPTVAPLAATPLPAGLRSVYIDILARVQRRSLGI